MKTRSSRERKKSNAGKYMTIIIGLFLILIMIASVLNSSDTGDSIKYKDYKFAITEKGYLTYKNNQPILLVNDPRSLEKIEVDDVYFGSVEKIYLSHKGFVPNNFVNLPLPKVPVESTYDEDYSIERDIPLKTCDDANNKVLVIMIKEGVEVSTFDGKCLIIQGSRSKIDRVVDKIILNLHGI